MAEANTRLVNLSSPNFGDWKKYIQFCALKHIAMDILDGTETQPKLSKTPTAA